MFKNKFDKDINLIIIGTITILTVIILGIVSSSQILKKETITNQLTISELNGKFLAENLNQTINNLELFIENINTIIDLDQKTHINNTRLISILDRFTIIRSINILDDNKIVYSSNDFNLGLTINYNEFFPKPLFTNNIIRVSAPWIGRDFISGSSAYLDDETIKDNISFIPILKDTFINKKKFTVIINLNDDFILNRFKERTINNKFRIELSRLDNILLLSNYKKSIQGKSKTISSLLEKAFITDSATGVEVINDKKQLSSYTVTKDYPFIISLHLDYEDSLLSWNKKNYEFLIISISIIILCVFLVLILLLLYKRKKENEILLHKQQIEDQEKFKRLFHDSHFMTAVLDKNGRILEINDSGLAFINKTLEKSLNKRFWEISCWAYEERIYLKNIFTSKKYIVNKKEEINALDKSHKKAVLEISIFTINKDKDDYKYIAIGQDITERKEKEKKLFQAYTVFDHTRDGIIITDKDTNIIDVNKAFELITGYSKNEILGKTTRMLKSEVHNEAFYHNMWNSLNQNRYWEGEIVNLRKDKTYYTEWLTINAILGKDAQVLNYIGIFSDITEEKEKEAIIRENEALIYQQSKMASMGEMIENIAHQWRQPLSVISTAATGIKMQKEFNITLPIEDEINALESINDSAQYLSETIEDFRHFLKNDKEFSNFSLEESILASIKLISSKLKSSNIKIIKDIKDIQVYGLRNEFIQVLINILNNARDALEESNLEKKCILINTSSDEKNMIVKIKNNGGPIPENIIDRIFEPYFTTKHQSKGTGIGLYMSTEIIRNHMKGSFTVKNEEFLYKEEKYKGPCFKIIIPL